MGLHPDKPVANMVQFVTTMAYYLAPHREGSGTLTLLSECGAYVAMVLGFIPKVLDPLPADYSWTPRDAAEMVKEMLTYD